MKCKYCESVNLAVILTSPNTRLYCADCGKYQKALSKSEYNLFLKYKHDRFRQLWQAEEADNG